MATPIAQGSSVAGWSPRGHQYSISVLAKLIPGNIFNYFSNGKAQGGCFEALGSQNGLISVSGTSDLFIKI